MARKKSSTGSTLLAILLGVFVTFLTVSMTGKKRRNWGIIRKSKWGHLTPFVIAQSKLETAVNGKPWTSTLAVKHNNIFGMGCVHIRDTTQIGCTKEFFDNDNKIMGRYRNQNDSIRDLLLWFEARRMPTHFTTVDEYINWIGSKGYFTDPNYLQKVKAWL